MRAFFITLATCSLLLGIATARGGEVLGDITIPRVNKNAEGSDFMPPARFPHWIHRTQFRCYVCHDAIFQMKAGADHITMDDVRDGRFCGHCHNGKTAFAVGFDTCERCHRTPDKKP